MSGGCRDCADEWAEEAAERLGYEKLIHPIPSKGGFGSKLEFTFRAHGRNALIAEDSDELYALPHSSRTGGTESTIREAIARNIMVVLIDDGGGWFVIPPRPPSEEP